MQTLNDLNDLRFIAAISSTGSLAGAARQLGVNHATVFRRVVAIEARLGVRLFERDGGHYTPTEAGEELARAGAAMEETALVSLRRVAGQDLRPSGVVRIATTDSIAQYLLPAMFKACRSQYPDIQLELAISNNMANLSKRDADIAVRPSAQPPDELIGRRIGPLAFAAYQLEGDNGDNWISRAGGQGKIQQWMRTYTSDAGSGLQIDSYSGVCAACIAGIGQAVLPCFIGDTQAPLRRTSPILAGCSSELWLLTHPDLRKTARISAIWHILQQELEGAAALLAGDCALK
jgi:DNA-binding transcriptional LysR family regulator